MADFPYLASNKNITAVLEKIRTAAKPSKFTIQFLNDIGFASSNDRAYPSLLKRLGFLTDDGTPTPYYDQLRDPSIYKIVLADRIRALYAELFTINTCINEASDADIKGAISRVTGKDAQDVGRIFTTFKALCSNADFSRPISAVQVKDLKTDPPKSDPQVGHIEEHTNSATSILSTGFHYNIQIHLPATTDISVYNAIFKSIRDSFSR